jgi:hypothetical protein
LDSITSFSDVSSWLHAHNTLWQYAEFRSLGRFHACIDAADVKLLSMTHDEAPSGLGEFKRLELTSFGRAVGGDVPRWWVFDRELDVRKLQSETTLTFYSAQTLVRSAEKICRELAPTYNHIIRQLGVFLQRHNREIEALLSYADKLSAKHELAPAILFSYAVWGSTRRADRSLAEYPEQTETDRFRHAGELALGIQMRTGPTLRMECLDLLYDAFTAGSDEEPASISATSLLQVVQWRIRESLVTYFTGLRDSFRHIDTLCQEFAQREHIYADDRFVKRLLKKISRHTSAIETDLWDITETLQMWAAPSGQRITSEIQFGESVAAFANKRGGIMIIGVTNDTHAIVGVRDPENRIKQIETVLRKHTDADVDFVRVREVSVDDAGEMKTCVIIVIGQTAVPVGVRQRNNYYSYPLRVGPGFERVSREQIWARKAHMKGTTFSFAAELAAWVSDVAP